jgi:ribonuclease HI
VVKLLSIGAPGRIKLGNLSSVVDIHTDGSSTVEGFGGAACVLSSPGEERRYKFNAYLGLCGSDTAELAASVLAFAVLGKFFSDKISSKVNWSSDSQVLLDSFVKHSLHWEQADWRLSSGGEARNVYLWKALSGLVMGRTVCCQHVSINSGDKELIACDKASRWAAESGKKLLKEKGPGPQGRLAETAPEQAWHLIDLEDVISGASENKNHLLSEMNLIQTLSLRLS